MASTPRIKSSGPALRRAGGTREGFDSNIAPTIAHHPGLAPVYMKFGGRLLGAPKLSARLREIIAFG